MIAGLLLVVAVAFFTDPAAAAGVLVLANAPGGIELEVLQKALKEHGLTIKGFIEEQTKAVTELREKWLEAKDRLQDLEQKAVRRLGGDSDGSGELTRYVMQSDALKMFIKGGLPGVKIDIPRDIFTRAITTDNTDTTGTVNPLAPAWRKPGIIAAPQRRLTIRDLFANVPVTSGLVEYCKENVVTDNTAIQGAGSSPSGQYEGQPKAQSNITFTLAQTPVRTVATWIPVSRQILSDSAALQAHLEGRLLYFVKLAEENELLNGDGTAGALNGIIANATAYNRGASPDTILDTIVKGMLQLALGEYTPSGIILSQADWTNMLLLKNSDGDYLLGNPTQLIEPRLWGLPVVPTNSMTQGEFVVVDAMRAGWVADREGAEVRISEHHNDFFVRNMVAMLAEERVSMIIEQGGAIVHGQLVHEA